jgi:hypothetical protein
VLRFDGRDQAQAWSNKDMRKIGDKYATLRIFAVEA